MKKIGVRLQYNAPVVLSFALLSLLVLLLGAFTGGKSTRLLFSVYRCSLADALAWPRFFLHVLGHGSYSHYIGNIMLLLVIGPPLEEKYGSRPLLWAVAVTALVSGLVHWIFFPGTALLGASGIVFMMIVMSSLAGMKNGCIPLTLVLVLLLYVGGEVVTGVTRSDNVSQLTHVIGGLCGAFLGVNLRR